MATIGEVVDRVFADALYGPEDQPLGAPLSAGVTSAATTITYPTTAFTPDEEGSITTGVIVQVDLEQMRVSEFVDSGELTVVRGVNGTTAAAHDAGAQMIVAPTFPRQTVFNAVSDAVARLFPHLWQQKVTTVTVAQPYTAMPSDCESVIAVRYSRNNNYYEIPYQFVTDIPDDGSGVVIWQVGEGQSVDVVYRAGFDRPTSEDDTFADLGLRDDWQRIIIVDAVSHLLSGSVEIGRATQDWLSEELSNTAYEPLTSARLAAQMDNYRKLLLRDAAMALRTRTGRRVRRRSPFELVPQW